MTDTRVPASSTGVQAAGEQAAGELAAGEQTLADRSLRPVMLVLAFACGASVANLYYAQPLLTVVARAFAISAGTAALIVTVTQVGYALGLALLLPLGDLLENRKLAWRMLLVTAVALVAAAAAPGFGVFLAALAVVGVTSVVAQVLVPFAAHLAPAQTRGKYVGQVTGGLLLGIMLARSVASFAAAAWGWRSIYAISAALMVLTAVALARLLPRRQPAHVAGYLQLVGSSVSLARSESVLVRRAVAQALMFGAFTSYWTAIAYELIVHHGLSQVGVAVFALVGAAGATAAPIAGRLGDRGLGAPLRGAAMALGVAALLVANVGESSLALLVVSAVLLDFAVQGNHVLSLRDLYALRPEARARITSVYMTSVFAGGALSSAATGVIEQRWGWPGVTAFAAILVAVAGVIWLGERTLPRYRLPAVPKPGPALIDLHQSCVACSACLATDWFLYRPATSEEERHGRRHGRTDHYSHPAAPGG
jgi:predicted MFS family arabinose efflux permease